jgi:hypothetical protein
VCEYVEVMHVWHRSHCSKFYNDLEVGYVGFIDITCAGAFIPHLVFKGMSLTRVNSTNVLDEGLRIGEVGRRMNPKVKSVKQGVYRK